MRDELNKTEYELWVICYILAQGGFPSSYADESGYYTSTFNHETNYSTTVTCNLTLHRCM